MPIMSIVKKILRKRIEQKSKYPELVNVNRLRETFDALVENGGERGTDSKWMEKEPTAGKSGASTS